MDKKALLEIIAQLCGTTEFETADIRSFLQIKQYRELQEPSKFLIVGGRGAGKTRVFKTLVGEDGFRRVIGEEMPFNKPNYQNTIVLVGYCVDSSSLPNPNILETLHDDKQTMAFWVGSIVLELLMHFSKDEQIRKTAEAHFSTDEQAILFQEKALKSPSKWIEMYLRNREAWENFLDEIDQILIQRNQWVILAYDQIDRISTNHDVLYSYIRTLVAYWFSVSNRWRRLKCKIFIRSDLRDSESIHFPDASKLKSRQIDLSWNTLSLYRLLLRRLANSNADTDMQEMLAYLSIIPELVSKNESIGYLPTNDESKIKEFITQLIGRYMGTSPKKGDSYSWVPNHLQDANGDLAPRPFLKCYACAAQTMLKPENERILSQLSSNALMSPSSIQGAVQEVSADRVEELKEDFPWIVHLKSTLEGGTLLMPYADFRARLEVFLRMNAKDSIPANSVDDLIKLLLSLGIIIQGTDGRINMPEIYLHGFGLKRKGGLRRPS